MNIIEKEKIISLYNTSTPIPYEQKAAVFEKYARLGQKRTQYSKGLGLFFCRMVMNAHDGRIWVESDDNGNCFKLAFKNIAFLDLSQTAFHCGVIFKIVSVGCVNFSNHY